MYNILKNSYRFFHHIVVFLLIAGCSAIRAEQASQTHITFVPSFSYTNTPIDITSPTVSGTFEPLSTYTPTITEIPSSMITPTRISTEKPSYSFSSLAWIAFNITGGLGILHLVDIDFQEINLDCLFCYSVSWSPDGHWLVYDAVTNYMGPSELYISRFDGSERKQITNGPYQKTDVAWSPSGLDIVYVESRGNFTDDICVVNIKADQTKKLTSTNEMESSPSWSPDGKYIAYLELTKEVVDGRGAWALMMMDSDGRNSHQVTEFRAGWGRIAWSPDGERIAFTSSGECGEIYTIEPDGSELTQITNISECAMNPTWSPDGKFIAFASRTEKNNKIWQINIMNADGTNIQSIYSGYTGNGVFRPDWKPSPSLIVKQTYNISDSGANLNLHDEASINSKIIKTLKTGEIVTVLEGPVDTDDYYWWKLRTEDGTEGWAVEVYGWYQPTTP